MTFPMLYPILSENSRSDLHLGNTSHDITPPHGNLGATSFIDDYHLGRHPEASACGKIYRDLYKRYEFKREVYSFAADWYLYRDTYAFLLPQILIQCVLALLPMIFRTVVDNPKEKAETLNMTVSMIAAISAAWLGLGAKLQSAIEKWF